MATIRIKNLKCRTIIGIDPWERETRQDVIINVAIDFDAGKASESDTINDTVDYMAIADNIIKEVETSSFFLLEKLAKTILKIAMDNHMVNEASVRVDKPNVLPSADSVSVELSEKRIS